MCKDVLNSRTVNVFHKFSTGSADVWSERINVGFAPDEMIIREVSYQATPNDVVQIYRLRANVAKWNSIICNFRPEIALLSNAYYCSTAEEAVDGTLIGVTNISTPQSRFIVDNQFINHADTYFQVLNTDSVTSALVDGYLSIQIEFIQYQK